MHLEQCVKHLRLRVQVYVGVLGGGGEGRGRSPFELCSHTLIHQAIPAIFGFNKGKVCCYSYFP